MKRLKYKIFKWLFIYSKNKIKESHLSLYHNDIKCDFCNEWFSISGVEYQHTYFDANYGDIEVYGTECGKCHNTSYWRYDIAPVAIRCDNHGDIL